MSESDTRRAAAETEKSREKRIARRIRRKLRRRNLIALGLSIGALAVALSRDSDSSRRSRGGGQPAEQMLDTAAIELDLDGPLVPQPTADSIPLVQTVSYTTDQPADKGVRTAAQTQMVHATGPLAVKLNLMLLEEARDYLESVSGYTALFRKEERVGDALKAQEMEMKLRHEPFSVYMKWTAGDTGRELLFVEGENDGKMIVHPGGWKARLLPAIKLDPHGSIAMRESRHPVTEVGLLKLVERLIERRRDELAHAGQLYAELTDRVDYEGQPCYRFTLAHPTPKTSEFYRRSVLYLDRELGVPLSLAAWTWPDEDSPGVDLEQETLVERYTYSDLVLNPRLADRDFDRKNGDYRFRR